VIRALRNNGSLILKTFYLAVIFIYFYSILGLFFFNSQYGIKDNVEIKGNTLYEAFFSTLNFGLRDSGGIGSVLTPVKKTEGLKYYLFFLYEISFYALINCFILQIIFGIIMDAFT